MIDTGLILFTAIHPGVIDVDVGGIVSVQDHADHVIVVIHLCKHQFHIRIIAVELVKFSFQRLKVIVTAGNCDMAFSGSVQ